MTGPTGSRAVRRASSAGRSCSRSSGAFRTVRGGRSGLAESETLTTEARVSICASARAWTQSPPRTPEREVPASHPRFRSKMPRLRRSDLDDPFLDGLAELEAQGRSEASSGRILIRSLVRPVCSCHEPVPRKGTTTARARSSSANSSPSRPCFPIFVIRYCHRESVHAPSKHTILGAMVLVRASHFFIPAFFIFSFPFCLAVCFFFLPSLHHLQPFCFVMSITYCRLFCNDTRQ